MKKTLLPLSIIVMIAMLIGSCTKNTTNTITAPVTTGTLEGFVTTLDQYGYKVDADYSGVAVTLNNGATTTTDATGKYEFDSLKSGNYTATYTKTGYGTNMGIDFNFIGGGTTIRNVTMSRIPSFQLYNVNDTIETTVANGPGILIRGIDTIDINARAFSVFGSASSGVSSAPASYIYSNTNGVVKAGQGIFSLFITSRELNEAGLTSGSTAYLAVYPISYSTTSYADPSTGRNVYTSVSASPAVILTVVVP
jgi:hypothetical protein